MATRCREEQLDGWERPPGDRCGNWASISPIVDGTSAGRVTLIGPLRPGGIIGQRGRREVSETGTWRGATSSAAVREVLEDVFAFVEEDSLLLVLMMEVVTLFFLLYEFTTWLLLRFIPRSEDVVVVVDVTVGGTRMWVLFHRSSSLPPAPPAKSPPLRYSSMLPSRGDARRPPDAEESRLFENPLQSKVKSDLRKDATNLSRLVKFRSRKLLAS
jgi:hypothetical protein